MSLSERITQCKTPVEAVLLLAKEIDELRAELASLQAAPASDPWTQPLTWDTRESTAFIARALAEDVQLKPTISGTTRADKIAATQKALDEATDPDDRRALEASLRLLKDTDANIRREAVPEGTRVKDDQATMAGSVTQSIVVGGGTVELPVVSPERQDVRRQWAADRKLAEFIPLDPADAADQYAKGGPMWLYLGNRDAVMQMPFNYRQELVAELMLDSPAEAQEVGRDILKQADSVDREITAAAIEGISASRGR
jgi:hypothetical protein